jgi:hypothetical protein
MIERCPFCGSEAEFSYGKVRCTNNNCPIMPKSKDWYTSDQVGYDLAVIEWNTAIWEEQKKKYWKGHVKNDG